MKIGVLAVQGAFIEHKKMIEGLGEECIEIRQANDLTGIDGIILPGGESTVQGKLLRKFNMFEPLKGMINHGLPVLATCAGLILLAKEIENDTTSHLGTLPVTVKRNAYGRQLGSFESYSNVGTIKDFPFIFIRAPYITSLSDDVKILSTVDNNIVGVSYKNQIGLSFHPELSSDNRIHKLFIDKIYSYKSAVSQLKIS